MKSEAVEKSRSQTAQSPNGEGAEACEMLDVGRARKCEKGYWPNEATASQAKGHNMVALSVASYGVVFMAGRDVARCVRGMAEAETVSGASSGHGQPVLRLGQGARIKSDPENVRKARHWGHTPLGHRGQGH